MNAIKKTAPLILSLLIMAIYCLFLLTQGNFDIKKEFAHSMLFQNMWLNLSQGSLAVDAELMGNEGFLVKGITTAYFLPFPSFVRGLLAIINFDSSAILSILLGTLLFAISSSLIWLHFFRSHSPNNPELKRYYLNSGVILFILGSPALGLIMYATPFWEAIIWANGLFITACYLSIKILSAPLPRPQIVYIFTILCSLTLFTRATFSFASCILFGLTIFLSVFKEAKKTKQFIVSLAANKTLLVNCLFFSIAILLLLTFNYAKWGNPFEFYPLQYYKFWDDAQKAIYFSHGALSFTRFPVTFFYYFIPSLDNFSNLSGGLSMGHTYLPYGLSSFDVREPALPLTLTQPILVMLFVAGIFIYLRNASSKQFTAAGYSLIAAIVASLIPMLFILGIHSLCIRYAGDFFPLMTLFAIYAYWQIILLIDKKCFIKRPKNKFASIKILLTLGLTALLCTSIFFSTSSIFIQSAYWKKAFLNFVLIPLELNEQVTFESHGHNDKGVGYLYRGWSHDFESTGTWSNAKKSTLLLFINKDSEKPANLELTLSTFIAPNHPNQKINVYINNIFKEQLSINTPDMQTINFSPLLEKNQWSTGLYSKLYSFFIKNPGNTSGEIFKIDFDYLNPASPKSLGLGTDDRLLGIRVVSARVTQETK